jgi:hypothetical protein
MNIPLCFIAASLFAIAAALFYTKSDVAYFMTWTMCWLIVGAAIGRLMAVLT